MGEADEHVLARALQPFAVILDKSEKTVDVNIVFEVDGQYVPHQRPFRLASSRRVG